MATPTTLPRLLAILAGTASASSALWLLCETAIRTGHWTSDELMMPLVVGITIAAGHLIGAALMDRRPLAALGFALLFALGTGLTVYSSVGRQAKASDTAAVRAEIAAAERAATTAKLAEAETMLAKLRRDQAAECSGGEGTRCKGLQRSIDGYSVERSPAIGPTLQNCRQSRLWAPVPIAWPVPWRYSQAMKQRPTPG